MEDNKSFGQRLKELRTKNNETQQQASEVIGIHINTLKNYEKGDRVPNANELIKIKNHYNVSYEYLLGESGIKRNDMSFIEIEKATGLSEKSIHLLTTGHFKYEKSLVKTINFIIENDYKYQFIKVLDLFLMSRIDTDKSIYKKLQEDVNFNSSDKLKYVNSSLAIYDMLKCSLDRILYKMENDLREEAKKEDNQ